jgi:hypothetical protein
VLLRAGCHLVSAPLNILTLPRPTSERRRSSWSEDLYASASIFAPKKQNMGTSLHGGNIELPLARLYTVLGIRLLPKVFFQDGVWKALSLSTRPPYSTLKKYPRKKAKFQE